MVMKHKQGKAEHGWTGLALLNGILVFFGFFSWVSWTFNEKYLLHSTTSFWNNFIWKYHFGDWLWFFALISKITSFIKPHCQGILIFDVPLYAIITFFPLLNETRKENTLDEKNNLTWTLFLPDREVEVELRIYCELMAIKFFGWSSH